MDKCSPTRPEPSESEFAHFFAQSIDLLCVADLDGWFKEVNPAWTDCLGWPQQQLLATPFLDFVHRDDRAATLAEMNKLTAGEKVVFFENRYRHRDGSFRWLRWNARPAPERQRVYAVARDITEQKRLEKMVLEILDREKERMGRELHDGLCQTLTGISALSATLARKLAASNEPGVIAAAAEITNLLNESIAEAHDLARDIGPVGLGEGGLDGPLEDLARTVQHRFGISCTLAGDRPFAGHHRDVEAHLYRITQEAVSNAAVHGRADRIEISLTSKDESGFLSISDNGVGLSGKGDNSAGIGLHTMAYRARLIGGSFELRPRARRGMVATCIFPTAGNREELDLDRTDP